MLHTFSMLNEMLFYLLMSLKWTKQFCFFLKKLDIYTPETTFGRYIGSHLVVGRLVGRSIGPAVRFPCPEHNLKTNGWNSKQLHTMNKHIERK
jgi:hypothetical protein